MLKNGNWDKLFGGHQQRVAKSPSTDIGYVDLVFIRTAQLLDSISTTVIFYVLQVCVVYDLLRP